METETQTLVNSNNSYIEGMPMWGQELAHKYCAKTVNLYCVSGNIRDFLPYEHVGSNMFGFWPIKDWIAEVLFGSNSTIIFYDCSQGISFAYERDRIRYETIMSSIFPETPPQDFFAKEPTIALDYIEKFFFHIHYSYRENDKDENRTVLILDYAELIVPAGEIYSLNDSDRYCLATLSRWANEPRFLNLDISILLLAENISDINSRLLSLSSMVKVEIPLPDEKTRIAFLTNIKEGRDPNTDISMLLERGVSVQALGKLSSGLNLNNLYQIIADSYQTETPINTQYLVQKKKEIIETSASGLLEFVESKHNLNFVSGNEFAKKRLRLAAKAIKDGHNEIVPMGYLVSGAIGTGKTFLVSSFAAEIGIPMVKIGNFHGYSDQQSQSKFEYILTILKAMAPVAVVLDEADIMLGGNREKKSMSLQSSFFSQLSNCMGNTEYRGKIIWFLITCRPDLLPIDLKRQGRAEEHLALFYPNTEQEKVELLQLLKEKLELKTTQVDFAKIVKKIKFEASGADLESILVRARLKANGESRTMITEQDLMQTIQDFLPPTYPHEIELQNLVASLECTSKELIPKKYQMEPTSLITSINQLKQLLGEASVHS